MEAIITFCQFLTEIGVVSYNDLFSPENESKIQLNWHCGEQSSVVKVWPGVKHEQYEHYQNGFQYLIFIAEKALRAAKSMDIFVKK